MGLEVPPWAAETFHVLTGDGWSAADEDEIDDLGRIWLAVGAQLAAFAPEVSSSARYLADSAGLSGNAQQSLAAAVGMVTGDGVLTLDKLAVGVEELSGYLHQVALQVHYMKIIVVEEMVILAAQIAYLVAMIPWTFGASAAGAAALQAGGKAFAVAVMQQVAIALAAGEVLQVGLDAVAQLAQLAEGWRADEDWNWDLTRSAAITGLVAGVLGPLVRGAGHYPTQLASQTLVGIAGKGASKDLARVGADTIEGAGHEYLTDGGSGLVQGHGWKPDTLSTTAGAVDEASTAIARTGGRKGGHHAWRHALTATPAWNLAVPACLTLCHESVASSTPDTVGKHSVTTNPPSDVGAVSGGRGRPATGSEGTTPPVSQVGPIIRGGQPPAGPVPGTSQPEQAPAPPTPQDQTIVGTSRPPTAQGAGGDPVEQAGTQQPAPAGRHENAEASVPAHPGGPAVTTGRGTAATPAKAEPRKPSTVSPAWARPAAGAWTVAVASDVPVRLQAATRPAGPARRRVSTPRPQVRWDPKSHRWEFGVPARQATPGHQGTVDWMALPEVVGARRGGQSQTSVNALPWTRTGALPAPGSGALPGARTTGSSESVSAASSSSGSVPALAGPPGGMLFDGAGPGTVLGEQIAFYRLLGHVANNSLRPLLGRMVSASLDFARAVDRRLTEVVSLPTAVAETSVRAVPALPSAPGTPTETTETSSPDAASQIEHSQIEKWCIDHHWRDWFNREAPVCLMPRSWRWEDDACIAPPETRPFDFSRLKICVTRRREPLDPKHEEVCVSVEQNSPDGAFKKICLTRQREYSFFASDSQVCIAPRWWYSHKPDARYKVCVGERQATLSDNVGASVLGIVMRGLLGMWLGRRLGW